eukprot:6547782-Karenia_brevis.AAC.1
MFPSHVSAHDVEYSKRKYKDMPEEFYTMSKLPVAALDDFSNWCAVMKTHKAFFKSKTFVVEHAVFH